MGHQDSPSGYNYFGSLDWSISRGWLIILVLNRGWPCLRGFPGCSDGKESICKAGDPSSIPGLGRAPGEGNGYTFQYSSLENSINRGAWQATIHGVTKNTRTCICSFSKHLNLKKQIFFFFLYLEKQICPYLYFKIPWLYFLEGLQKSSFKFLIGMLIYHCLFNHFLLN